MLTIENCKTCENKDNDIYIEIGDATNNNVINSIIEKYGNFDIILDDGSHKNKDVIKSFELLFPLMNDGGLYIVEDTICYKDSDSIDVNYPNHLNYIFHSSSRFFKIISFQIKFLDDLLLIWFL